MVNTPVIFETHYEFLYKRTDMYIKISESIKTYIINDNYEYGHMKYIGLTPTQKIHISNLLNILLKEFTQNKCNEWCDTISSHIVYGIEGFIIGLLNINKIKTLTAEELSQMIISSITYQLGNCNHCDNLLAEVVKINENYDSN